MPGYPPRKTSDLLAFVWTTVTSASIIAAKLKALEYMQAVYDYFLNHVDAGNITYGEYCDMHEHVQAICPTAAEFVMLEYSSMLGISEEVSQEATRATNELSQKSNELFDSIEFKRKQLAILRRFEQDSAITGEHRHIITKTIASIVRKGIDNPHYSEIQQINKRLEVLQNDIQHNLSADKSTMSFDPSELPGLPESYIAARCNPETGRIEITNKIPDYLPIYKFCTDRNTRKKAYEFANTKCVDVNVPLMREVLALRQELATLLGHRFYLDHAVSNKMSQTSETVIEFLTTMIDIVEPYRQRDMAQLQQYLTRDHPGETIAQWDIMYYIEIHNKEVNQLDMRVITPKFDIEHVYRVLFEFYEHMLGIKFIKQTAEHAARLWHGTVELYELQNKATGETLGYLYLDNVPRSGKCANACACDWVAPCYSDSVRKPGVAIMICNFDPDGNIAYSDIKTLFHEMGHCMHLLLGDNKTQSANSFGVEYDFVETPSQLIEFFLTRRDMLVALSQGRLTDIEIDGLAKIEQSCFGYYFMRQLMLSLTDVTLHSQIIDRDYDFDKVYDDIYRRLIGVECVSSGNFLASWGHIFNGYQGGYYGYQWSRVFACDIYMELFNGKSYDELPEAGARLRESLYGLASTMPASDVLRQTLRREPRPMSYIEYLTAY